MNLSRAASKPTVGPPIPPTQATLGHNAHGHNLSIEPSLPPHPLFCSLSPAPSL